MGILLVSTEYCWLRITVMAMADGGFAADWQMHEAVAAIAATRVSPIVRIAANEGWMVKRESISDSEGRGNGDQLTVDRGLGCGRSWNRRASFVYC